MTWEPVGLGPHEEVPGLPDEVREKVEDRVRLSPRCGYDSRKEPAETAEDHPVDGDERPVSGAQARQVVDRLWLERMAEQETWEGATDPSGRRSPSGRWRRPASRPREHFTCCRGSGTAEIGAEREGIRGFVFFHRQATERRRGHGLSLCYGGFDGSAATTTAVGHEVVAAFTGAGLSAVWDGDPERAIELTPLDWRKRLVGRAARRGIRPGEASEQWEEAPVAGPCLLQWAHGQFPEVHRDRSP
ncbi:DUF6891 domain-containing protein [Streptomyces brasiliensis]|uniref:DUF6891 domain-containing protein n=1 Tax=Streptomyces brasiliensis TaxID=1954 RepID=A0A917P2A0_9ACTN|nr:hypothetical protein [Streptomyces brasiliensis]GGJ48051.1 hypothetical protein GCM10010121_069040 [Streptomyces brasiliensis]